MAFDLRLSAGLRASRQVSRQRLHGQRFRPAARRLVSRSRQHHGDGADLHLLDYADLPIAGDDVHERQPSHVVPDNRATHAIE